jgi:hypothetical protein
LETGRDCLFTGGQHSADCGRSDGDANFSRENFEGNSPNRAQTDVHHLTLTERNVNLRNTVNLRRLGWHLLDTFYLIIARQALAVSENHTGNHFRPEKQQQRPLLAQNKNIPRAPGLASLTTQTSLPEKSQKYSSRLDFSHATKSDQEAVNNTDR